MRVFISCAAACFSVIVAFPSSGGAEQLPYTADDVCAAAADWKNSFHSLRVDYRWSAPGEWKRRNPELSLDEIARLYYCRCIWTYGDDSREKLESWFYERGQLVAREVEGNDGRLHYLIRYVPGSNDPERYRLWIPGLNDAPHRIVCHPVRHLYYGSGGHDWHDSRFRESLEVVGTRVIDDALCVGIRRAGDDDRLLWLDTTHDFLLRLLEPEEQFVVEEYRQLEDGRWFPARGKLRVAPDTTPQVWRVNSVRRNPTLDSAAFALPARPDADAPREARGRGGGTSPRQY
ncbi:hypothetical protein Mal4_11030 [Maioricimonas rarisocia]|uniref:DUF1571 domain-containing protein n=1 Tax=Maioricimonas rarisocia TaxID=2528026 RepID=A0A517Z2V5_9PLAN|nr:hypothetical protein [Maioricimonas rarisocia]QDU36805.1 hypothetical protein Mal4_11030 [Maioricimonas rarisocia]